MRQINIAEAGHTDVPGTFCNEPWGFSCQYDTLITLDSSGQAWYYGTGSTPGDQHDYYSAVIHEFGHALHVSDNGSCATCVMDGTLAFGEVRRTLKTHDIGNYTYYYGSTH